jgi:hypothetical protein
MVVCAVICEPVSTENSRLLGNLIGNFDFCAVCGRFWDEISRLARYLGRFPRAT